MKKLEQIFCNLEIKAEGDANSQEGFFEGYASTFGNVDFGGDIIQAGAFEKSLSSWGQKGQLPFLLAFHDLSRPIGDWLEMRETEKGLFVRGQLWVKSHKRIEDAVRVYNMLQGTGKKEMSIGFRIPDGGYEVRETATGSVRVIKEIDLVEVSVVPIAMNEQALVTSVKSLTDDEGQLLSKREVEKALRDAGLSSRQAKAFIASGYDALERDAKGNGEGADRDDQTGMDELIASLRNYSQQLTKGTNQ